MCQIILKIIVSTIIVNVMRWRPQQRKELKKTECKVETAQTIGFRIPGALWNSCESFYLSF